MTESRIDSLRLQQFRSYHDEGFEFDNGVNIIVGPNASGKTNLLEALLVGCRGSSFRARDTDLVEFNKTWARLDLNGPNAKRTVKLLSYNPRIKKEFEINGQTTKRLDLSKTVPVVLFEPSHLFLFHRSPERRRDYLDDLLEQTVTGFIRTRREYKRILAQRNALLKQGPSAVNQLFAWNVRLSEIGSQLAKERFELINKINTNIESTYRELSGSDKDKISVSYNNTYDIGNYSSRLLNDLEKKQSEDFRRGFTTVGPHREDFSFFFDEHSANEVASRGETRTAVLALKVLELELVEAARDQKPLLLLDDVFSELDGSRRKALTEALSKHQTFITTTDADVILHHFTDNCRIIPLTNQ